MRKQSFRKISRKIGIWGFMAIILFITYFPILIIILQSVNADSTGNNFKGFTLKWYSVMLDNAQLTEAIMYTLIITFLSTLLAMILGTITAIGIHGLNAKKRKTMIMFNNIPILNADIITGIFLFLIFQTIGNLLGIRYILGFWTLLAAHVLFSTPYVILSVLPKLNEMDENVFDAALDLGCTPKSALRKVIIPTIKGSIFTGCLLAFTMSIDDFVISYFVSGSEISNFSIWLNSSMKMGRANPLPQAYAYNTIITLITVIFLVAFGYISSKRNKTQRDKTSLKSIKPRG